MEDIIRFEQISKNFGGVKALSNVSFGIKKAQVHALVGENGAGKSTLMNILSGIFVQDDGKVIYQGKEVRIANPHTARQIGIATVFQELKNCDNLNVTENIFLGREEKKGMSIDWKGMHKKAREIMERFEMDIDVKKNLSSLTVAQKQMIEIAKAIDLNADVLILDEPTSALTVNETKKLFRNIERLRTQGVSIIFISHRLEEIFEIADEISVMRNGCYIGTHPTSEISVDQIIRLIAGKELLNEYTAVKGRTEELRTQAVLEVRDLKRAPSVSNVGFSLRKKEILGFYGLQGSGRTETMETLFGLYKKDAGEIRAFGEQVDHPSPKEMIGRKIGMVTEDRKLTGAFFNMDINDNIAVIHDKDITKGITIDTRGVNAMAGEYVKKLSVKCSGIHQMIGNLSGGNQQKVILSRCLSTDPKILILDEPTRGVDVGAKAEIYEILRALRDNEERSIIVVSSELPEIILLCDRVLVMHGGTIVGELCGDEICEERILMHAFNES